jgi:hypothetical protein
MSQNESPARSGTGDEYPDAAGYPDGTGTLDEGTSDASPHPAAASDDSEIEDFALSDEEDVEN